MNKNYTIKEFENTKCCGTCTYWDASSIDNSNKSYCSSKGKFVKFSYNEFCTNLKYEKSKDSNRIKQVYQKVYNNCNPKVGCYITTMIVNILGKDDDCVELKLLRKFRNCFLQTNQEYTSILAEYDIVGPKIANCLEQSEENEKLAEFVYKTFIKPTCDFVILGDYNNALKLYVFMVEYYKKVFNLDNISLDDIDLYESNTTLDERGHGNYTKIRK